MTYDVVVPTVGRPSLRAALIGLASGKGPLPERVILVDDRRKNDEALDVDAPFVLRDRLRVVCGGGRGPGAARNAGSLAGRAEWIAFLDDDVVPPAGWREALARDIADAGDAVATQGRVRVVDPDPQGWVRGLETAVWITADMAYRRDAFIAVGGFDERFPRAYREDSDLGLRATSAGGRIARGKRWVEHPVPDMPAWKAVARQRGNADDALMLMLHGRGWRERAAAPRGMRNRHLLATGLFAGALLARATGMRMPARLMFGGWLGLTVDLARRRRDVPSSVAIPFAATWWWLFGLVRAWRLTRKRPRAVLFDRDGTLVEDVPYNGDPRLIRARPGAREALDRLRTAGVRLAMVTNQSGIARGLLTDEQVRAVNAKVEELVGPFDATLYCGHGPDDGCSCRKPRPGLLLEAARRLGVRPADCAVVGDIESDVVAARNAGARGVLVPNQATRSDEVARAKEVALNLERAVDRLLGPHT
jgi:histidinol-phosphate phosphatase family protein